MLSSEYGWSTEYIMSRTTKEIAWRVNNINKRLSSDVNFQANIHGVKLKNQVDTPKVDCKPLSKEQEDNLSNLISSRIKKGNK